MQSSAAAMRNGRAIWLSTPSGSATCCRKSKEWVGWVVGLPCGSEKAAALRILLCKNLHWERGSALRMARFPILGISNRRYSAVREILGTIAHPYGVVLTNRCRYEAIQQFKHQKAYLCFEINETNKRTNPWKERYWLRAALVHCIRAASFEVSKSVESG